MTNVQNSARAPHHALITTTPTCSGSRRASAATIVIGLIAASAVAGIAVTSLSTREGGWGSPTAPLPSLAESSFPPAPPPLPPPATSSETAALLARLGLAPERLAAAGVTAAQTTALVGHLRSHLASHIDALRAADATYSSDRVLIDLLQRSVRAGTASPQDRQTLDAAVTRLAATAATRQQELDAAYTAATDGLAPSTLSALARAFANTAWELPGQDSSLHYAFADRSEQDWVALRDALSAQRIAARYGSQPDQPTADLIAAAASDPAAATAAANLAVSLAEVTAAWSAALEQ